MKLAKIGRLRALLRYFRDSNASIVGKLFVFAAVVYVISPVDLVPDVPVVGWLDDMGVMSLAVAFMWKMVAKYRDASVRSDGEVSLQGSRLPQPS
ncbi:MAG: DUF1232 domain-containing protein [Deltaproteobacteria bacterium]|nr:DUF1232 domain-containing protein [Deltaproteobacteria bacterium]